MLPAFRQFMCVWMAVVRLSATMPVLATWFILAVVSGHPQISTLLRQTSDTVGIGLILGLLCGVVAFWFNLWLARYPLQDASSFSFEVIVGTSLFGSLVGFGIAHL